MEYALSFKNTVHSRYLAVTFFPVSLGRQPKPACLGEIWLSFVSSKSKFCTQSCCTACNIMLYCTMIYRESIILHHFNKVTVFKLCYKIKSHYARCVIDIAFWGITTLYDQCILGVLINLCHILNVQEKLYTVMKYWYFCREQMLEPDHQKNIDDFNNKANLRDLKAATGL